MLAGWKFDVSDVTNWCSTADLLMREFQRFWSLHVEDATICTQKAKLIVDDSELRTAYACIRWSIGVDGESAKFFHWNIFNFLNLKFSFSNLDSEDQSFG